MFATSFPPPWTGQNVASSTLYGFLDGVADRSYVDTSKPDCLERRAPWATLAHLARRYARTVREVGRRRPDVLYVVLSSSRLGRLRDAVLLTLVGRSVGRVVGHVQVGDFAGSLGHRGTRRVLRRVDAVLALSPGLAADLEGRLGTPVEVVPNTVPADWVATPDELRARRSRDGSALDVLFVANHLPGKGADVLAEGVARYNAAGPARPAALEVVGVWPSPEARRRFEASVTRLGLDGACRVRGGVGDRADLRRSVLEADVVALPSAYAHEALPVSLVEALATGTPVIGTDWRGIPDLVTPETGVLLRDRSPQAVADALAHVADPERWQALSRGAFRHFASKYHPDIVRRAFLGALLDGPAPVTHAS